MKLKRAHFFHSIAWRVTFGYALLSILLVALSVFSVKQISLILETAQHGADVELPNLKSSTSIQLMATELESKARLVIAASTIAQTRLYLQQSDEIIAMIAQELTNSQQQREMTQLNAILSELELTLHLLVSAKQQLIDDERALNEQIESSIQLTIPLARAAINEDHETPIALYFELNKLKGVSKAFERTKSRINITRLVDTFSRELDSYPKVLLDSYFQLANEIKYSLLHDIESLNELSRKLNGLSTQFKVLISAMTSNSRKEYNEFENTVSENSNLLVQQTQSTVTVLLWLILISIVVMVLSLSYLHRALYVQSRKLTHFLGQQSLSGENIHEFDKRNEIGLLARTILHSQQTVEQQKLELQRSNDLLEKILDHVDVAVVLVQDMDIQACNELFQTEFSAQIGQSVHDVVGLSDHLQEENMRWVNEELQQLGNAFYDKFRQRWYLISAIEVIWGARSATLAMIKDVTEQQVRQQKFESSLSKAQHEALTDSLTSLYNRKRYDMEIQNRNSELLKSDFAILVIDIDHFKIYNDRLGHAKGDVVIQKVAQVLANSVRESDLAIRYGGEEFVLILKSSKVKDARQLATRISKSLEMLEIRHPVEPGAFVTLSIGCADSTQAPDLESSFKLADSRLYEAKAAGRNCIR